MMHPRYSLAALLALVVASSTACSVGCGVARQNRDGSTTAVYPRPAESSAHTAPVDTRPRVVFLGDSLTAGLGLAPEEAYPTLVQQRIDREELPFQVVNAGVSG